MRIASCLKSGSKTRAEISGELKSIPIASVYRKIKKLEKFGIIRKATPATPSNKKYKKRHNDLYELVSEKFVLPTDQDRTILMAI